MCCPSLEIGLDEEFLGFFVSGGRFFGLFGDIKSGISIGKPLVTLNKKDKCLKLALKSSRIPLKLFSKILIFHSKKLYFSLEIVNNLIFLVHLLYQRLYLGIH